MCAPCVQMGFHPCVPVSGLEAGFRYFLYHSPPQCFETRLLTEAGADSLARLTGPQDPWAPLGAPPCPLVLGFRGCTALSGFYVGAVNTNLGTLVCRAGPFPTEPSSQSQPKLAFLGCSLSTKKAVPPELHRCTCKVGAHTGHWRGASVKRGIRKGGNLSIGSHTFSRLNLLPA